MVNAFQQLDTAMPKPEDYKTLTTEYRFALLYKRIIIATTLQMPLAPQYVVGELLRSRQLSLALAESCTGGLIASLITDVPGSSQYFLGSVVAYAYEAKEQLLDIPRALLLEHGAVSEPVTRALARSVRSKLGADIALAVTGIMGPGGATESKPLGLTYIALVAENAEWCRKYEWSGNRLENKLSTANAALAMLIEYLERPAL